MDRTSTITFLVRMARRAHRDARRFRSSPTLRARIEGERFAYLNAARYLHKSSGARVRNIHRRIAA